MAKFRMYNIQLLPNAGYPEVGVSGYKRLFSLLRDKNKEMLRNGDVKKFHYRDARKNYIGPFEFNYEKGFIWGRFKKYSDINEVVNVVTGKSVLDRKTIKSSVTDVKEALYVFDARNHTFAIDEGKGALPSVKEFCTVLINFFEEIVKDNFQNYTLSINVISQPAKLEEILKEASGFKNIKVQLNEPNGLANDILEEMRDKRIKKIDMHISAGRGGIMTGLIGFMKGILAAATTHGNFELTYTVGDISGKDTSQVETKRYKSEDSPVTFVTRQSSNDNSDVDYVRRIYSNMPDVNQLKKECEYSSLEEVIESDSKG